MDMFSAIKAILKGNPEIFEGTSLQKTTTLKKTKKWHKEYEKRTVERDIKTNDIIKL